MPNASGTRRPRRDRPTAPLRYRHKKRGTTYRLIAEAGLQASEPVAEGAVLTVYQSETDGRFWARPVAEFADGRFERIEGTAPAPGDFFAESAKNPAPVEPLGYTDVASKQVRPFSETLSAVTVIRNEFAPAPAAVEPPAVVRDRTEEWDARPGRRPIVKREDGSFGVEPPHAKKAASHE